VTAASNCAARNGLGSTRSDAAAASIGAPLMKIARSSGRLARAWTTKAGPDIPGSVWSNGQPDRVQIQQRQRPLAAVGEQQQAAHVLQDLGDQAADIGIVLDNQDDRSILILARSGSSRGCA
jgi:hypothetical protein